MDSMECVSLLLALGFITVRVGLHRSDIDFEYPSGTAQGRTFANLLTELRSALDALAKSNGDTVPYQLAVSSFYTTNSLFEQGFLPPRWPSLLVTRTMPAYVSLRWIQL
jgi:hypothetical protein